MKQRKINRNETKLATALRLYMEEHKLSNARFAAILAETHWQCRKCSATHIHKYLNGSEPGIYAFIGIARTIGVKNIYDLMEDCEPGSDTMR